MNTSFMILVWFDFMNRMALLPTSYAELDLADFMAIYALTKVCPCTQHHKYNSFPSILILSDSYKE